MPKIEDIRKRNNSDLERYDYFDPGETFSPAAFEKSKIFFSDIKGKSSDLARMARHKRISFNLNFSWRALFSMIFILGLITIGLARGVAAKNNVEKLTKEAEDHLISSFSLIESGDIGNAIKEADQAKTDLSKIKLLAQSWGQDLVYLRMASASNSKLVASERLLDVSYNIITGISALSSDSAKTLSDGITSTGTKDLAGVPSIDLGRLGANADVLLRKVISDLMACQKSFLAIKNKLPADYKGMGDKAMSATNTALNRSNLMEQFFSKGIPILSGQDGSTKNILILLQNNSELRGSGGFIGSYSVATFSQGKLTRLEFETNIYKIDDAFTSKTKIDPPQGLEYTSVKGWALRDSNFAVDFPESANKISEFYHLETGKSIDGIMAMDTTLFTDLLRVLGPIDLPNYGKTITSDNFLNEVQYEVEKGYFERSGNTEANEPKTILADMMPLFFGKLIDSSKDSNKLIGVLNVFQSNLKEKHLMINFKDSTVQGIMEKLGYAGKIEPSLTDYLFVNNSNLGGNKSSLNVQESLKHQVRIENSGEIDEHLEITRKHNGSNTWPDGPNNNLIRVLFPQNSNFKEFNEIKGNFWPMSEEKNRKNADYSLGQEANKSEITFWQNTAPGETSRSAIDYKSNYRVDTSGDFDYTLCLQKQPGALADDYELDLIYPEGFEPTNVKNYDADNNTITIKYSLNQDKSFVIKFKRSN